MSNIDEIENLQLRMELISILRELSDKSYQLSDWFKYESMESLDIKSPLTGIYPIIHFLFDDWGFDHQMNFHIGYTLYNQDEADAVMDVLASLEAVMDECEPGGTDRKYVESINWDRVILSAKRAMFVLLNNQGQTELARISRTV